MRLRKRKTNPRCPRCGGADLILVERASTSLTWYLKGDKLEAGAAHPEGIEGVDARCNDCEKRWTLRGVLQITCLPAYESFEQEVHPPCLG